MAGDLGETKGKMMHPIKWYRINLEMSQHELADAVGICQQMISACECGVKSLPAARVDKLASVLQVKPATLKRRIREWLPTKGGTDHTMTER